MRDGMASVAALQEALVESLTGSIVGRGDALVGQLADGLDSRYAHRLVVYQRSFVGRTVAALSEAVFGPAERLFSTDVVKETLARYFSVEPPKQDCMVAALAAFPRFLAAGTTDWHRLLLAALAQLSLDRWQLLYDVDPAPRKVLCALTMPPGPLDLYAAWTYADSEELELGATARDLERFRSPSPTGVLTIKTSPCQLAQLAVPASLADFAAFFAQKNDVLLALEAAPEDLLTGLDDADFRRFLAGLQTLTTA